MSKRRWKALSLLAGPGGKLASGAGLLAQGPHSWASFTLHSDSSGAQWVVRAAQAPAASSATQAGRPPCTLPVHPKPFLRQDSLEAVLTSPQLGCNALVVCHPLLSLWCWT